MRCQHLSVLLCLTFIFCQSAWAQEPRRLAVIVGVDAYRTGSGLPSLKHAGSDAHQLAGSLREQGYTVFEMTHAVAREVGKETMAPNADYIRDQITGVLGFPNLGAKDSVILSFHGHGVQYEIVEKTTVDGESVENPSPKFFFCPADTTIEGLRTANEVAEQNHLLPLDELYKSLGQCKAATKLLIVDACRNDPSQPGEFRTGLASATLPKLPPPPGGIAAFFSCKANERAVEDPDFKHGVFTHFLVQGMQGRADQPLEGQPADGIVTFAELSAYVANNTYAHVYKKYKVRQSPELRGEYDLNLPFAHRLELAKEFTNSIGMKLVLIPAGTFLMGSPESEADRSENEAQHRVTLSKDYYLGATEVTQSQWQAVMVENPTPWNGKDFVKAGNDFPAIYVCWEDAVEFCRKLRLRDGKNYHLPSEAEWELACRAKSVSTYSFGNQVTEIGNYAWISTNAWNQEEKYAHEVAKKLPNAYGLYDMHGNVREWCADIFANDFYKDSRELDPVGPSDGLGRVYRGGAWSTGPQFCRSACRGRQSPDVHNYITGLRVACDTN